jgi:hypothetical protein
MNVLLLYLHKVLHGNSKVGRGGEIRLKFSREVKSLKDLVKKFFSFLLVKAYHIKWGQLKTDTNIAKWSVQLIELDQNKRHLDCARIRTFWDTLDQYVSTLSFLSHLIRYLFFRFIAKHKSNLRY